MKLPLPPKQVLVFRPLEIPMDDKTLVSSARLIQHMMIFGTSGQGKSMISQKLAQEFLERSEKEKAKKRRKIQKEQRLIMKDALHKNLKTNLAPHKKPL